MSEFISNYETYTFGYTLYGIPELSSDIDVLYDRGFLPYTGSTAIDYPIFYHCRSLRVDLSSRSDTSENRRVLKKIQPLHIQTTIDDIKNIDPTDTAFRDFCIGYTQSRFYHAGMTAQRFDYIMTRPYANKLFHFTSNGKTIGYTIAVLTDTILHHRFCFFDTTLMDEQIPLGKYLMRYTIDRASRQGLSYVYLGTCYKKSGLYKARDFKSLQYRDGNTRSSDINTLKQLCDNDEDTRTQDLWKTQIA